MPDIARMTAFGGLVVGVLAVVAIVPNAMRTVADEPRAMVSEAIETLFPPPFDARVFRKYAIEFGPEVSTDVLTRRSVTKIGFGQMTKVAIITTSSGTYSSDGLVSPHVRYPGIAVAPRHQRPLAPVVRPVGTDGGSFIVLR